MKKVILCLLFLLTYAQNSYALNKLDQVINIIRNNNLDSYILSSAIAFPNQDQATEYIIAFGSIFATAVMKHKYAKDIAAHSLNGISAYIAADTIVRLSSNKINSLIKNWLGNDKIEPERVHNVIKFLAGITLVTCLNKIIKQL